MVLIVIWIVAFMDPWIFFTIHNIVANFLSVFGKLLQFFRRFHDAYVDAVSNPFHIPGKKITSKIFAERVSTIVKSFGLSSGG